MILKILKNRDVKIMSMLSKNSAPKLALRGTLRLQMKDTEAVKYIKSCKSAFKKALKEGKLQCVNVFTLDKQIFLYYESKVPFEINDYLPEISNFVEMWPGQKELRPYVPMTLYYQSTPMETVPDWKEARIGHKPYISISRMKIEKLESYIFYHYQLQEEKPGDNGRYLAIWGNEEWCILYGREGIDSKYNAEYKGKLDTANTPKNWRDTMLPHFYEWNRKGDVYRNGKLILSIE